MGTYVFVYVCVRFLLYVGVDFSCKSIKIYICVCLCICVHTSSKVYEFRTTVFDCGCLAVAHAFMLLCVILCAHESVPLFVCMW